MDKSTCKDCAERHIGCHAECPKYAEEKRRREEARAKRREGTEAEGLLVGSYIKRARSCRSRTTNGIRRFRGT